MNNNNKKGNTSILFVALFIVLVLVFIGYLTQYHKAILMMNYNLNVDSLEEAKFMGIKEELEICYGFPINLDVALNPRCENLFRLGFKLEIVDYGVCSAKILYDGSPQEYQGEKSSFTTIKNSKGEVCLGLISYRY